MKARGLLLAPSLVLCGCGYMGETQPPSLKLPTPVRDMAAVERGDKLIVQFTPPTLTTDGLPLKATPKLVVYVDDTPFELHGGHGEIEARKFYGKTVRVAVKARSERDRDAGFSNVVTLPVVPAIALPANLKVEAVAAGIRVAWDSPVKQFVIFRQAPGEPGLTKLDDASTTQYVDKTAEYGKEYRYAVQALSNLAQSEIAEAAPYTAVDTFPPAVPAALAAVVGIQSVELVWDRSTEPDFASYRIYRDAGTGQFERIGESKDAPSFSDKAIEKGKRYRYAVTAIDKTGNESALSEPAEAAIP